MPNKAQGGSGGAMVGLIIVIILVVVVYFYYEGYIKFPTIPNQNTNNSSSVGPTPLTLSASATGQTTGLFPGENFQVLSVVDNSRSSPITVSLLAYGCSTILGAKYYETIPANVQVSKAWNITAPSSGSCQVQFTACFNYSSYANYPLTITNSGVNPPVVYPSFSNSPISLTLQSFNNLISAPPSSVDPLGVNETEYILGDNVGAGSIFNSSFDSLTIYSSGKVYVQLPSGTYAINGGSYKISSQSSDFQVLSFTRNYVLPFVLNVPPVSNTPGYSNEVLNISAVYSYCLQSNAIPVSVS